jgi:hypothetical protein
MRKLLKFSLFSFLLWGFPSNSQAFTVSWNADELGTKEFTIPGSSTAGPYYQIEITNNSGTKFTDITIKPQNPIAFYFDLQKQNTNPPPNFIWEPQGPTTVGPSPAQTPFISLIFETPIDTGATNNIIGKPYDVSGSTLRINSFTGSSKDTVVKLTPSYPKADPLPACSTQSLKSLIDMGGCSYFDKNYIIKDSQGLNLDSVQVSFSGMKDLQTISFNGGSADSWDPTGYVNYKLEINSTAQDYVFLENIKTIVDSSSIQSSIFYWQTLAQNSYPGTCEGNNFINTCIGLSFVEGNQFTNVTNQWTNVSGTGSFGFANTTAQTPAPIPVLGGAVFFKFSRKLRERIRFLKK